MTLEEFTRIIDLYGSESAHWPKRLRADCEAFVANSIEARSLLNQQWALDELMGQIDVPDFPGLESRVLNQALPERNQSFFDPIVEWLLPQDDYRQNLWRPAVAACLPLVFGIVLANYFSFGVGVENDGFQYWGDELAMLSLTDYTETGF
tara:strand:- start:119 stop:568 length:450 start_codon:yes stop_codon:yes gene_type:complete